MHGNLFQSRCESCGRAPFNDPEAHENEIPKCQACGSKTRPNIVWFGEVPMQLDRIYRELEVCTVFVAIGTSGVVRPAAAFVAQAKAKGTVRGCYYIGLEEPVNRVLFDEVFLGRAADIVPDLFQVSSPKTRS